MKARHRRKGDDLRWPLLTMLGLIGLLGTHGCGGMEDTSSSAPINDSIGKPPNPGPTQRLGGMDDTPKKKPPVQKAGGT